MKALKATRIKIYQSLNAIITMNRKNLIKQIENDGKVLFMMDGVLYEIKEAEIK